MAQDFVIGTLAALFMVLLFGTVVWLLARKPSSAKRRESADREYEAARQQMNASLQRARGTQTERFSSTGPQTSNVPKAGTSESSSVPLGVTAGAGIWTAASVALTASDDTPVPHSTVHAPAFNHGDGPSQCSVSRWSADTSTPDCSSNSTSSSSTDFGS